MYRWLPSGKRWHSYGTSPLLMGQYGTTDYFYGHFRYVSHCQRLNLVKTPTAAPWKAPLVQVTGHTCWDTIHGSIAPRRRADGPAKNVEIGRCGAASSFGSACRSENQSPVVGAGEGETQGHGWVVLWSRPGHVPAGEFWPSKKHGTVFL